jgi:hypothetical protein
MRLTAHPFVMVSYNIAGYDIPEDSLFGLLVFNDVFRMLT